MVAVECQLAPARERRGRQFSRDGSHTGRHGAHVSDATDTGGARSGARPAGLQHTAHRRKYGVERGPDARRIRQPRLRHVRLPSALPPGRRGQLANDRVGPHVARA